MRGEALFQSIPRAQQRQIWQSFSAVDVDGDNSASLEELTFLFEAAYKQGLMSGNTMIESTRNIVRAVASQGTSSLSLAEFKAMVMLATLDRSLEEQVLALRHFFDTIDSNSDGTISTFQLANIVQKLRVGLQASDFTNLAYMHFGRTKSTITKDEFVAWLMPNLQSLR